MINIVSVHFLSPLKTSYTLF